MRVRTNNDEFWYGRPNTAENRTVTLIWTKCPPPFLVVVWADVLEHLDVEGGVEGDVGHQLQALLVLGQRFLEHPHNCYQGEKYFIYI